MLGSFDRSARLTPLPAVDDLLSRLSLEHMPTGVLFIRPDGIIAHANSQFTRQVGCPPEQVVGEPVARFLPSEHPSMQPEVHRLLAGAPAAATARVTSGRRADGGEFPAEITLKAMVTDEGPMVLATVIDVSGRLEAQSVRQQDLQDRIDFERLVADLSTRFINLPDDSMDQAIRDALARIGTELSLDRANFYRVQKDGSLTDPVSWIRPGHGPPPAPVRADLSFPWSLAQIRRGQVLCFESLDEVPSPDRDNYRAFGIKSALIVPLSVVGEVVGAVGFNALAAERSWSPEIVHRLQVLGSAFANAMSRQRATEALKNTLNEVTRLRDQLQAENVYLRQEVQEKLGTGSFVGQSAAIARVLAQVEQVAATDSTVLLLGETGTGKELLASRIHELSARHGRPMVRVNCAAIPATLIESELFGRERGAFTGALTREVGRFELADRSTIFLDEIGDVPAELQVKLLRVLEERQIERLGSPRSIRVDTRIIAATHRDLEQRIAEGTFREDLFYRLNVFPIVVPPLRDRVEDIPLLVWRFVGEFSKSMGKRIDAIPRENMEQLQRYAWPGNIRELRNIVERAMIVTRGPRLTIALPTSPKVGGRLVKLLDVETEHIRTVLDSAGWRIRGAGGAAERLGLRPTTLETRMAKLGLVRPKRQGV
jgi:formate hydrogenlyase transcriptional activator